MMSQQPRAVCGLELWQWRNQAIETAIAHDILPLEVDWLLQEIAGLDRLALRLESFKTSTPIKMQLSLDELEQLWQRRLHDRLPVQYIAGVTPWRFFKIAVSNAVLIPRPETECLIDLAVVAAKNSPIEGLEQGHWADLGTGSGAIALGLADVLTNTTIHAVDLSPEALAVAQTNAKNLGFAERIKFYQGSWWEPLKSLKCQFSGMVSNPPYIPTSTVLTLQPEVVNHEPHLALDGGVDGLDYIRHLIDISPHYLRPGGVWLIEMMAGQADTVRELLQNHGSYENIQIHADLAGIERFALACKKMIV
ncbi:peptide chain release factor N(5)-glutamine methyltransferase [Anabaena cylindrica FACHB-243]|uniref:Release factor glutamine methyltransferase n=1 Tax=Anabaena cylindrica (strain ATCC 27899 / PCC 7122) TaxID=272123 RepID=K9ZBN6_ANACC|nr:MULTISPECIES: peptide chain release factor N(5)-glutamine methyltransferase [Anabaena]AFZ56144.1 protein-(glutamine-N5) methyltransferase, release factor-specific [Anabaena cylindrica PCC 7122]MBD2417374.1 peptide chain release factor N(5)-glutamine methyltransferase [Anabaena cylindrica FACHB-243]MBY5282791.1 peptide chain release factor N(5)-glutamine methyltransferase [Anabaena sp. CCAP 1446/1C]MBY5307506.1 peptide chain release factor N(5)-glutamine methyltransferase [Anabaena sp. CCAP 1